MPSMIHQAANPPRPPIDPDQVETMLRAADIDNFTIDGNIVRIGSAAWMLSACACGFEGCDGWALEPIDG